MKSQVELDVVAVLCELTDELGWDDRDNRDERKLAAFAKAKDDILKLIRKAEREK